MKKILLSLGLIGMFWGLLVMVSASSRSCKEVNFDNGVDACINIEKAGSDRRDFTTDLDGWSEYNLRCDLMTPDSVLRSIPLCNGEFSYDGDELGRVKIRVRYDNQEPEDRDGKPSSSSTRTYPQRVYDFDNEERASDTLEDNNANGDLDSFDISLSDNTPDEDDEVTLTIKALDSDEEKLTDYEGSNADITIQYKASSSDTRHTASSTQVAIDHKTPDFSNGEAETDITFKYSYLYKITVTDEDEDIDNYETFEVGDYDGGGSSNGEVTQLAITDVSDETPNEDYRVNVTVEAQDDNEDKVEDFTDKVKFKVEVRDDTNNERDTATSSDYELDMTSYTFTSSDYGDHDFEELVRFKDDSNDYRLVVYDYDDSDIDEGYQVFDFGNGYDENDDEDNNNNNDYNTDNFYVTTNDSSPDRNDRVDLTIKARDGSSTDKSYKGSVDFEVRYKESGYSNRNKVSTSNSLSYYEMKYPYEDDGYTFRTSNYGEITISDFIRFKRENYEYKVIVKDSDHSSTQGYKIFTVGSVSNDSSDTDNFYLSSDDSSPSTSQYVDLTVKARAGTTIATWYRGKIYFDVYYKSSGSYTRTKTTSSTYYTMAGSYEEDGYTFTSSNKGEKTFSNLIKFNKNNYSYKVVVYDSEDEFEGYKTFTVGSVSNDSNVDGFTSSELRTVQAIYDARPDAINRLVDKYPRLESSTRRNSMADDIYEQLGKVIDDDNDREYSDFMDFYNAFLERYRYTLSIR